MAIGQNRAARDAQRKHVSPARGRGNSHKRTLREQYRATAVRTCAAASEDGWTAVMKVPVRTPPIAASCGHAKASRRRSSHYQRVMGRGIGRRAPGVTCEPYIPCYGGGAHYPYDNF